MDIITTSLEALIQRATSVTNQGPDTAAIDAFCGLINKEPKCAQVAAKFITSKVHTCQEWEALQALLLLENCMKRGGSAFQAEIGTFRFLNELIKLVSPKYMGAQTPEPVRRRVLELLRLWTIQYPREVKIREAYDMLKKQGVVKEDPPVASVVSQKQPPPSILQDEEKSQLLHKLLQSKNPDDLQAANRLIKSMVKEDEEKGRHALELEKTLNNCRLLNEMLDSFETGSSTDQDLELIRELHSTCRKLRPMLFSMASSNSEPGFCQNVLLANDELSDMFKRYETLMKLPNADVSNKMKSDVKKPQEDNNSSLLDLTPSPSKSSIIDTVSEQLTQLDLDISDQQSVPPTNPNYMSTLDDIFGTSSSMYEPSLLPPVVSPPTSSTNNCLDKIVPCTNDNSSKLKGFKELDLLGKSLLQEGLLQSKNAQSNKPPKVSLNDMVLPKQAASQSVAQDTSLMLEDDLLLSSGPASEPLSLGAISGDDITETKIGNFDESLLENIEKLENSEIINDGSPLNSKQSVTSTTIDTKSKSEVEVPLLPLSEISITLDSIKPSSIPPFVPLEDENGLTLAIFLAKERPRPDVSVFVVTTSSKNQKSSLSNFSFQPVVPKICRLRLLTPSSNHLPAHNPFLPPSAITQIMLIASPNMDPIRLKFLISYVMDEETFTELGEINSLPLVDS